MIVKCFKNGTEVSYSKWMRYCPQINIVVSTDSGASWHMTSREDLNAIDGVYS